MNRWTTLAPIDAKPLAEILTVGAGVTIIVAAFVALVLWNAYLVFFTFWE